MMNVYYKNHLGETIDLKRAPYHLLTGDILDYTWETLSCANRITGFEKGIHEKTITFEIFTGKTEYHRAMNRVTEVFEKDILAGIPGRLYMNGQYLKCYITDSKKTEWESDVLAVTELIATTDYPYWITEKEMHFEPTEMLSAGNKKYPFRYPYRYSNGLSDKFFLNEHYAETDFRMLVFGPAVNPAVFINAQLYQVNMKIESGEYVVIDSSSGTITLVKTNGTIENAFNFRKKDSDIFKKIPQGNNRVRWNGAFGFDLILFQERSQPKCA